MAQITETLYNEIAQAYANIDTALSGIKANAKLAALAIVDVNTTGYSNDMSGTVEADAALEITLALINPFNSAYVASDNLQNSTGSLLDAVRAVNDFVITNTTGTDTAKVKLDTWINTTMTGSWDGANCPTGWKNLSQDAGYDTSSWTVV